MSREDDIVELLTEIRDGQREALNRQREHVELAREQAERMRRTAEESLAIQRTAVDRVKRVGRIVLPLIIALIALVVWLIVKYRIL
jgi:predicted neutral ceramidase superfamily lipid hydrolase